MTAATGRRPADDHGGATMTAPASARARTPRPAGDPAASPRHGWHDPWKTTFFVVAVLALLAGIAWALLGSSFFVVRSIQVTGGGPVPKARVLAAAGIRRGTPLIRIDTGAIARRVDRITWVQSARVRRSWPDSVLISTVPRTAVFAVREGSGYDVIDRYGVLLGRESAPGAGLVLLKAPPVPAAAWRASAAVHAAGAVLGRLPGWLRRRLSSVKAAASARVILRLRPGITVIWGDASRATAKARELKVLLRTSATYYDLSDPQSAVTGWPASG